MPSPPGAPLRLSVSIVVHHSSLALLQRLLQSLQRAAAAAHAAGCAGQVSVRVIDNSLDAQYRQRLLELLARTPGGEGFRVDYAGLPDNRGFGAGHNSMIREAESEVHLVLNPDTELAEEALCTGLSRLARAPDIALLSPRVCGPDGAREYLCKRYPSVLVLLLRGFAPEIVRRLFHRRLDAYELRDLCSGEGEADVPLASGCFMLARTAALRAVGGFDERYFLYFEDYDLSLRLAGQGRLVFLPAMQIVHHGGYAAGKGRAHLGWFVRSGIRFFRQHGWRWI
jgi:GT2 family glycosyltransferase